MKIALRLRRLGGTSIPGFLRRLTDPPPSRQLAPALVPAGVPGLFRAPSQEIFHPVFGRRRDETPAPGPDESQPDAELPGDESAAEDTPVPAAELPPIPSAPASEVEGESEGSGPVDEEQTAVEPASEAPGWAPYEPPSEPSPFSFEPEPERPDLPAWTPTPLAESAFPAFPAEPDTAPGPWASPAEPEVVDFPGGQYQGEGAEASWPGGAQDQVWPAQEEGGEGTAAEEVAESQFPEEVVLEAPEVEAPAEEPAAPPEPAGPVSEYALEEGAPAWEGEEMPTPEPTYETYQSPPPEVAASAVALVEGARAFPLPEGEVLFRNLRAGFTDPARLLRHLAGEGHTGVLHVAAVDGRNTYVVLVDGYVVAVAGDSQGRVTTTNRVAFPNFPNSQDVLNVITYPRETARGLALLLHAPVHFGGLGAMFVDLDGLRSYLSKHSASGGMVVASNTGTGVALFDDGRLVGAYLGNQAPEEDLTPLRELVKDQDAEIDVRMGGPKELDPIPLDTLLAGYPL